MDFAVKIDLLSNAVSLIKRRYTSYRIKIIRKSTKVQGPMDLLMNLKTKSVVRLQNQGILACLPKGDNAHHFKYILLILGYNTCVIQKL